MKTYPFAPKKTIFQTERLVPNEKEKPSITLTDYISYHLPVYIFEANQGDKLLPCVTANSSLSPHVHICFIKRDSKTFFFFYFFNFGIAITFRET